MRRLAVVALQLAPDQKVELLVRTAQFHVCLERHRVVALCERIEKLVDGNRRSVFVAFREIVALQNSSNGVFGGEPDQIGKSQLAQPFVIEADFGFRFVENLENLRFVRLRVGGDFFRR